MPTPWAYDARHPLLFTEGRSSGNRVGRRARRLAPSCRWTQASAERAEELQALIDASPLALVEYGLDTRIRLWNPAAERIFGWTRAEMIGRGDLPLAPPGKRGENEELFGRVIASAARRSSARTSATSAPARSAVGCRARRPSVYGCRSPT